MGGSSASDPDRPDLRLGVPVSALPEGGAFVGRVGDDKVLLVRRGAEILAVGARCTHYGGPLGDGVVSGDTVRCPLHHACFSLRTGEALAAPAFDPIPCWRVDREADMVFVREKMTPAAERTGGGTGSSAGAAPPVSVVIVGGGAAGFAAAEMLRREGYAGPVTMITADPEAPYDRPNLSKDYLTGEMQADWLPLQPAEFYAGRKIDLLLGTRVTAIDTAARQVRLDHGAPRSFGALLLATGADPIRPPIPGADGARVFYLRTLADSAAIVARAKEARRIVVVGAGFIGLEAAAILRGRGMTVDVVAPDRLPLERVMGAAVGGFVRRLHEAHGVTFHLGETVTRIDERAVTLSGGSTLPADLVLMGVGVRPSTALAETAGLAVDRGVVVNQYLETSADGIFAAGDVARYPDPRTGERVRIEHWVVAQRQGQTAARNILGRREPFDAAPFFWTQQYDVTLRYVGHAGTWDEMRVEGNFDGPPDGVAGAVSYLRAGRRLAVATVGRDRDSLVAGIELGG